MQILVWQKQEWLSTNLSHSIFKKKKKRTAIVILEKKVI